jgi:hypothetical protein
VEAEVVFNNRRELQEIDLYPIRLGFQESRTQRGRPFPATGEMAAKIISRLAHLSESMGTDVKFRDNKGVIVSAPATMGRAN